MRMSLDVMALSFAAFLILLGAGTYSTFESVYAQVNVMPGSNEPTNTTPSGGGSAAGIRYNAAEIAQTHSKKADSDVHNLVILIPDTRLVTQGFLPLDATIVEGTKVIWSNGDNSAQGKTHGISLVQDSDNQVLLSNNTIPFGNASQYTFDTAGT